MYVPRNPHFSEFSYAYAVTEDLVVAQGTQIIAAPVFPSLIEEGQYGFDVMISRPGFPLFLQFKLAHYIQRRNATETKMSLLQPPFYRMHLRSTAISNQHAALLALERAGNEVFYTAPAFHLREDFNEAYRLRQVWVRSFQIRPTQIGELDINEHHVAFKQPGAWHVLSEENRTSGTSVDPRRLLGAFQERVRATESPVRDQITDVDHHVLRAFRELKGEFPEWRGIDADLIEKEMTPLSRISYLARQFFDCQFFIVVGKATQSP
jgi:hypothetical protein